MPATMKRRQQLTPAPTNLTTAAEVGAVGLSWSYLVVPAGFTRYEIFRGGVLLTTRTTTSYSDTTAASGVSYSYTVEAVRTNPNNLQEYRSLASNSATGSWSSAASATIEIVSMTSGTGGPTINVNTVTGADNYRLERSLDPLSGFAQVGADQASTSFTDATGTAGVLYYYRAKPVTTGTPGAASRSRVGTKTGTVVADAIALGALTLTPNFTAIHIDLAVTVDTNLTARAHAEVGIAVGGTTVWRHCLPMRRSAGSFISAAVGLTANTAYTIRVTVTDTDGVTGSPFVSSATTTRVDSSPTYASLIAATTHYVNFDTGDDARTAAVAAVSTTPWKTYNRAIDQANTGAITNAYVQVAAGYQPTAATQLTAANTRIFATNAATLAAAGGRFAPRDDTLAHTVIYGRFLAPTASDLAGDVANTTHNIYGKGGWTSYAPAGQPTWTVWQSPDIGVNKIRQFHYTDATPFGTYTAAKAADPKRLVYWRKDTVVATPPRLLGTLDGFCEFVNTNLSMNSGFWMDGTTNIIYAKLPSGVSPNTCYCWMGRYGFTETNTAAALDAAATGFTFAGFNIRALANGIRLRAGASNGLLMRNLTHGCNSHYAPFKNVDGTGCTAITIQDFRISDSNLWREDYQGIPWMIVKQKARLADGTEYPNDPPTEESETTGIKFNGAGRQFVIRRGDIIGPFNGIGSTGSSTGALAQRDVHIHDLYMAEIADNCIEPEGRATNWIVSNITIENVRNFISTSSIGAVHHLYRIKVWQWGVHGLAPDVIGNTTAAARGGNAQFIKFGAGTIGATTNPSWVVLNSTAWSNKPGVKLWAKAIGQSSQEAFVNRNNILRTVEDVADNTVVTTGWDNDANLWGGSVKCELRGVIYDSAAVTGANSIAAARTAGVMGTNDNKHGGTDYNLLAGGLALIDSLMTGRLTGNLALTTASAGILLGGLHDDVATASRGYEG